MNDGVPPLFHLLFRLVPVQVHLSDGLLGPCVCACLTRPVELGSPDLRLATEDRVVHGSARRDQLPGRRLHHRWIWRRGLEHRGPLHGFVGAGA